MSRIKIEAMGGMRPLLDARMLPDQMASYATNVIVRTGALRPLSTPTELRRWANQRYASARRLLFNDGSTYWYPLQSADSAIIKAPLVNDSFERFYILDPPGTPLRFNTRERIVAGQPSYLLGLPAPTAAPTVAPQGGTNTLKETRAYVYTFVDEFGQEGPPSPPEIATGPIDATPWRIGGLDVAVPDATQRPAITKRIYRTVVASNQQASFQFVAEIPLAQASYDDVLTNVQVALNFSLGTMNYLAPPANLEGLLVMPGGFLVGWRDRTLHFSESYRPWAWPAEYDLALDFQIVGGAVIQQTLVVATRGHPYTLTGNSAAAMSPSKQDRFEPCLSRQSIVAGINAVFYVSANGLIAVNAGGTDDLTHNLVGRDLWLRDYAPNVFGAARIGAYYMAFNDSDDGLGYMVSTDDPREGVIRLQDYRGIVSVWDDAVSDDVLAMVHSGSDSVVLRITPRDPAVTGSPRVFSWRSKEFFLADPSNFGALMINAEGAPLGVSPNDVVILPGLPGEVPSGNDDEFFTTTPIPPADVHKRIGMTSVVGYHGIGATAPYINETQARGTLPPGASGFGWIGWPFWPGLGGSEGRRPETNLDLPPGILGVVRVFANRRLVYRDALRPNAQVRLPSGFKASVWQVLVVARVPIYSVHMASTGRELQSV